MTTCPIRMTCRPRRGAARPQRAPSRPAGRSRPDRKADAFGFRGNRFGDAMCGKDDLRPSGTRSSSSMKMAPSLPAARPRRGYGRFRGAHRPARRTCEGQFDNANRSLHARAEAAWGGEQQLELRPLGALLLCASIKSPLGYSPALFGADPEDGRGPRKVKQKARVRPAAGRYVPVPTSIVTHP